MVDNLLSRAHILLQQNRYNEAGDLLRDILRQEPDNIHVLAMLSQVFLQQNELKKAKELIDTAIGLSPDGDFLFYIKARIALHANNYKEAEANLQHAIQLNPGDADYFALWSSIKLNNKAYSEALELADHALQLDAENMLGLNMRSSALIKLNRKEDAFSTIEGALANDPNDAYTHTNYGWSLLEKGDPKKALYHFREALQNDPNNQNAQAGMGEALKSKYLFYRLFLQYAFFMNKLTSKYQWGVIIGFYALTRILGTISERNPQLSPYLTPISVLLAVFAFSTWVITPISNLFLRFNVYGKFLLKKEERLSSNFVAVSLLVCITGLLLYFITFQEKWMAVGIFGFAMMVPFSAMFVSSKHESKLKLYTALLGVVGILSIAFIFLGANILNGWSLIFVIGFIAFQWVANLVSIRGS